MSNQKWLSCRWITTVVALVLLGYKFLFPHAPDLDEGDVTEVVGALLTLAVAALAVAAYNLGEAHVDASRAKSQSVEREPMSRLSRTESLFEDDSE